MNTTTKLKESGFEVYVVDHGEKALAEIEKVKPDLVLLDIVLPHMDGWDILENVKANEHLASTEVVILSNLGQKEEIEKGMKLGAARYLIKAHYTPSQIVQEVVNLIGGSAKNKA